MKELIEEIKSALAESHFESFEKALENKSRYYWQRDYPIAVVHNRERIESSAIIALLEKEGLLDEEGFTPECYSDKTLALLAKEAPNYIQSATLMALTKATHYPLHFKEKFPKDFWKKLQDFDHIKAVIETAKFTEDATECSVEFSLRDVMRKRKEVNVLKKVGYVWIAAIPKSIMIESVMQHYFLENRAVVTVGEMAYHIGWSETLKGINMRYFVCPPA